MSARRAGRAGPSALALLALALHSAAAFSPHLAPVRAGAPRAQASARQATMQERDGRAASEGGGALTLGRRDAARWVAGAAAAVILPGDSRADDFGSPMLVLPAEKKLPPPSDPYSQMESFGESFRGKKGPNLQLPETLSVEDETPAAMTRRDAKTVVQEDFLENLAPVDIIAALLWGGALYFGTWFDVNTKTNMIQSASGDEDDVRPSDWLKLKLGGGLGMGQETWSDQWEAPLSLQAFTLSFFAALGVGVERLIAVNLGDSFALMSGMTAGIWAGVYELGRMQQKGYRLTREEQDAMDELHKDFAVFAEERIVLKPTARMHMREFTLAFRGQFGKYRTQEQISDAKLEGMFKAFARKKTGMKGKAGYYKGIGVTAVSSPFGGTTGTLRREKESQAQREADREKAEAAAARAMSLAKAEAAQGDGWDNDDEGAFESGSESSGGGVRLTPEGAKRGEESGGKRSREV